ncbi:MAG: hypothetical protein HZR80_14670 [Candidatus Heimdallarchaeota archaeon]
MKIKLSSGTLKKILIGTTVINYILLVTYVFLLISASIGGNYTIFLLSVPAYILSNSWLLIVGFFGFEACLLFYYWMKTRNETQQEDLEGLTNTVITESELLDEDFDIFQDTDILENQANTVINEQNIPNSDAINVENEMPNLRENPIEETNEILIEENFEVIQAEKDFDRLWEEAIDHVKSAVDKKKAGEPVSITPEETTRQEISFQSQNEHITKFTDNIEKQENRIHSRAIISKWKVKHKKSIANPSIIKDQHREFYNEIALNNWIFQKSSDRDRVGLFKTALDETRFREKDFKYLIEVGIIHKLLIPFPTGSFVVYAIQEKEDKKIIRNYIAKWCKKNNFNLTQKSIAFVNYSDLGLDRKNWRFDFQINNIIGLIWISDFLIRDDHTGTLSLAYHNKKELKALLAASQINFSNKELTAMIVTDYGYNIEEIERYIENIGFGQATILAVGDKRFEKQLKNAISA